MNGLFRAIRVLTCVLFITCAWVAVFEEQDVTLFLALLYFTVLGVSVLVLRGRLRQGRRQ